MQRQNFLLFEEVCEVGHEVRSDYLIMVMLNEQVDEETIHLVWKVIHLKDKLLKHGEQARNNGQLDGNRGSQGDLLEETEDFVAQ